MLFTPLVRSRLAFGPLLVALIGHLSAEVRSLQSDLQLIADRSIIERLSGGASLRLGQPILRETILKTEHPWEGTALFISSLYQNKGVYHILYRGLDETTGKEDAASVYLCLATSRDGIHWERPKLGLVEYRGSKENNITATASGKPQTFMFTFYDPRPGVPEDERVKGVDMRDGERRAGGAGKGLRAQILGSADGRVWRDLDLGADLQSDWPNAFDGGSISWSEVEQQFVGYFRWWDTEAPRHARTLDDWMIIRPGVRSVFRSVSKDLKSWSKPEPMSFGDSPAEHIYEAPTIPYFRNPKIYLSLASRFNPGRRALSLEEERALNIRTFPGNKTTPTYTFASDANDVILLTTRAGTHVYDRPFMEAFLRPGLELGNWGSRSTYAPLSGGFIETAAGEISFFVTRHHLQKTNSLQRVSLRTDGFVSVNGTYGGGEMVTVPLTYTGDHLELNFSTSGAGEVRVEVQDTDGKPLPGFSLEDCDPLIGDRIAGTVRWRGQASLSRYVAKPVRLRIQLLDADVYSFRFAASP
ncbi:MAG TPA: hypothetical protein PLN52_19410 [Opitutaceae bacterium]|nr:hypothetical protein [Opitutaceae bacterium]